MPNEKIENNFKHHSPDEEKIRMHEFVRDRCKSLANDLDDVVIDSREKALAMTKLEEVMMWANAAIARNK